MTHPGISLPNGDVLIHAGDATSEGLSDEVTHFLEWFSSQPHPHKILIAGNHDWLYQRHPDMAAQLLAKYPDITYLEDSGVEIEGVRFWGSPWQPWFCDWAFNLPRKSERLREVRNQIPLNTDVLITHGPPFGLLDQVQGDEHLGCEELKIRLAAVRPRVNVFGHIHDGYGVAQSKATTYINACICTEEYQPLNRPIVVDLLREHVTVERTKTNQRKERLEKVKAKSEAPEAGPMEKAETWLPQLHAIALKEMADLRGMSVETLLQAYALRGLHSDVAKQLKAESRSSNRITPFLRLDDET